MAGLTADVAKRLPNELMAEASRLAETVEKNKDVHKSYGSFRSKLGDVIDYMSDPDTRVDVILSDHGVPVTDWIGSLRELQSQVDAAGETVEPDTTVGKLLASQVSIVAQAVQAGLMDAVDLDSLNDALVAWSKALDSLGTHRARNGEANKNAYSFPFKVALYRPDGTRIGIMGRNTGACHSFNIRSRLNDEEANIPPRDESFSEALTTLKETGEALYKGFRLERIGEESTAEVAA